MRTLLLFRGAPGCGKSTYIKEHNLEQYVLSADTLRLMCQSAQETPAGQMEISPQNDDVVWEMLFKLLEVRMSHGEFTVIDATNSKTVEMNRYKNLAKQYRYRMYVINMTDLPIEECKRRNAQREWLKRVPEAAIDKLKLPYYKHWKFLRGVMQSVQKRGYYENTAKLFTAEDNLFYGWMREQREKDQESFCKKGIIQLRNEFYENRHE